MSPHDRQAHPVGEMVEQGEWYKTPHGRVVQISDMTEQEKRIAARRLESFALSFARSVFSDLYCYGYPSGEQAQMDVERGEGMVEIILESEANAREWMRSTTLYETLTGRKALMERNGPEDPDAEEGWKPVPSLREDRQTAVELASLDKAIARTRENLAYLEELRGRLA